MCARKKDDEPERDLYERVYEKVCVHVSAHAHASPSPFAGCVVKSARGLFFIPPGHCTVAGMPACV